MSRGRNAPTSSRDSQIADRQIPSDQRRCLDGATPDRFDHARDPGHSRASAQTLDVVRLKRRLRTWYARTIRVGIHTTRSARSRNAAKIATYTETQEPRGDLPPAT
jgi:hypothetical protein